MPPRKNVVEEIAAPASDEAPARGVSVRRVLKAYEQIAEQLRDLIMSGELAPGERLPNEANLARQFGVSRATVRESLRVLSAQNLIRTAKGSGGGSYVTLPTIDHLSEFIRSNSRLADRIEGRLPGGLPRGPDAAGGAGGAPRSDPP